MTDTTEQAPGTSRRDGTAGWIGLALVRFVVPLWVVAGASAKLEARSPSLLPRNLIKLIESVGIDLHVALSIFIAIEFAAVAVMVLLPRMARGVAMFMLGSFCLVLIYELLNGNITSCGCFGGGISPPPWLMLAIDLAMLIAVAALPIRPTRSLPDRVGIAGVTLVAVALGALTFTRVMSGAQGTTIVLEDAHGPMSGQPGDALDPVGSAAQAEPSGSTGRTVELPAYYSLDTSDWAGRRARDIDLLSWVGGLPADIDTGQYYVIFYSRTCEHCLELLLEHFSIALPAPTVLVAIPETTEGFEEDGALENPCVDCLELDLPVGVDWLMTPPVVVAIENGVVRCAKETEDAWEPECLPWHGF